LLASFSSTGEFLMLPDGFYGVKFKTQRGEGAGVAVLTGGKLRGGDSALAYSGSYQQNGDNFTASVKTSRHAQGMPSVFGVDAVDITLSGKSTSDTANCTGSAAQAPGVSFQAVLTRISD
jgi:hypothetical protein